ncbi:pre-toxin TG domain-containing protein [Niallia sp. MER 6]|uniref:pre-toxin TG domain-containing protein n=1 Tax=Niallia sp. MER 6 TaxID=2939567 RepID=UPI00203FB758|nr:pre-toxin TG domain-containing protein [Niallia sp. MER 6]MCM3030906.1 pre-toxin TG domain-containing protein [Niallia sp. MER 6]
MHIEKERRADEMISEQRKALEKIFRDIDDLVSLTPFSRSRFDDLMMDASKKRTKTVDAVEEVDQELKDEYLSSQGEEYYVQALFQSLMEATRQGSSISPIHFDAEAYQSSDAYQSMVEAKTQTNSYLSYKKEEKEAREIANRPWYEDLWEGTKTFAGELTGYYDYIRAKDGVDPVTGAKLTAGQRVAAGAMAAAGFIPIVGWAGRALKGGKGIYSATKAIHTADNALDAYKNVRTFTKLEQTEMGIYGLISANGLSEYLTGKDMFGNKLTDEQRQASITQSMIGAIPFVPYAPSMIKEAVRISELPVHKTYQLVQTGLSKSQLKYKGFLTNIYQPNSQLSPLGPSMAMFKSHDVNNNVKKVSNHSVKSTSRVNTTKKTAGETEVKYDFSQYEKKLVGNTWVLSKNGRTDQDAAKASLAYNEAIKKGEVKLDNEPDSDIYLEQIQAAKEGYNLWTGEGLSKLESNSIIFSSLIGSVYGFRGGKISGRSIKVSKGDLGKIREKVKGNKANTEVTKGIDNVKDITKLTVDDIPTAKSGNFNKFFNSLTSSELDELWKDKKIRKKIERQLREPGGLHEWHLVSRAPQFKYWNIGAEEIKDLRTAISDVKFVNPNGVHGGLGSTKAHNELLAIIDTSSDYNTFVRRLNNWANYRLEGGVSSLPQGLRLK